MPKTLNFANEVLDDLIALSLPEIRSLISLNFEKIKKEHIKKFRMHPVTLAMLHGGDAGMLDGYGDLNSFFGIPTEEVEKQVDLIEQMYENSKITIFGAKKSLKSNTFIPTNVDIFKITPLSWAKGRSWAEGVERGFAGFGRFLENSTTSNRSRTDKGIQVKGKLRGGKMKNVKYISQLLKDFENDSTNIANRF